MLKAPAAPPSPPPHCHEPAYSAAVLLNKETDVDFISSMWPFLFEDAMSETSLSLSPPPSHMASPALLCFVSSHASGRRGELRMEGFNPSLRAFRAPAPVFSCLSVRQMYFRPFIPLSKPFSTWAPPLMYVAMLIDLAWPSTWKRLNRTLSWKHNHPT